MKAVVDNDVILKGACYHLLTDLVEQIPATLETTGVLGAAKFVLSSRIAKQKIEGDLEAVERELDLFFQQVEHLEPTEEEIAFAAELEVAAKQENLPLDDGESLLCAMVVERTLPAFATGDKRAIKAIERLLDSGDELAFLEGRIICLEQLVLRLVFQSGGAFVRSQICAEPAVDKALTNSFSCRSGNSDIKDENCIQGLRSYIGAVRSRAGRVLGSDELVVD